MHSLPLQLPTAAKDVVKNLVEDGLRNSKLWIILGKTKNAKNCVGHVLVSNSKPS